MRHLSLSFFFFFNDTATTEIYTLSLHDALPISDYDAIYNQLRTETDEAKRRDLIIKANDLLVSQVVVIPMVARTQPTDGISKAIQGDVPNPWDSVLWNVADWVKTGGEVRCAFAR